MSIQKRTKKDGSVDYRVSVEVGYLPDGSRDRQTKVCKTKREAQQVESRFNMLKEANQGTSNRISLLDFIDIYWRPEKERSLRKNTMRGYERDIKLRLIPAFGDVNIGDIKRARIQSMIDQCDTYKVGKNARDTLSSILGLAVDMELLTVNPARGKFKFKPKQEHTDFLGEVTSDHKEHMRIISLADTYEVRAICVLGLLFGLRKGEILGMEWADIDLKENKLRVRRTYTRSKGAPDLTDPKTQKSVRTLPIGSTAHGYLKELRDWGGITRISGEVLTNRGKRMSPDVASKRIGAFCEEHDLGRLTMASMRHSFATAWVLAGKNVAALSKWLGHTNITTTYNRYVIPLMKDLVDEATQLDELYKRAASC